MRRFATIISLLLWAMTLTAKPLMEVAPERVGMLSSHLQYIDRAVEREVSAGHIPGAVVLVVKSGSIPYFKAFGHKCMVPRSERMERNTVFDLASCTKPLSTTLATMILMERGELSLRDNLDLYIPDFNKNRVVNGKKCMVAIRHLMTHSSGIEAYVAPDSIKDRYGEVNRESFIEYVKSSELCFPPDSAYQYSCLNFITMQHIIEQITGETLDEFTRENIYKPLGLKKTGYHPLGSDDSDAFARLKEIAPTEVIRPDSVIRGVVHDPLAYFVGGGVSGNSGLFSTAEEVAILAEMILEGGSYNGVEILRPNTVNTMCKVPHQALHLGRSYGWDVYSDNSSNMGDMIRGEVVGHTGFTGCSLTIDRENDMAIILLTNAIHSPDYEAKYMIRLRALIANIAAASIVPRR